MHDYVTAFDVGGTRIKAGLVALTEARILARCVFNTPAHDRDRFEAAVEETHRSLARDAGLALGDVGGAGITAPGFVDTSTGRVVTTCGFLAFMERYPLAERLHRRLGIQVRTENDARAIALAEARWGVGRAAHRLACYTFGTGVGLCLTQDGHCLMPDACDFTMGGHMVVDPAGPECYCGARGCLESLASATGLVQRVRDRLEREGETWSDGALTAQSILEAARAGDAAAAAEVERTRTAILAGIHTVQQIFAPDVHVLGGGMAASLADEVQPWERELTRRFPYLPIPPKICVSNLGEAAGILGAACLFMTDTAS